MPDSTDEEADREDRDTSEQQGNAVDLHETRATEDHNVAVGSRSRTMSSRKQVGVMRPGSQAREYDLIPGIVYLSVTIF